MATVSYFALAIFFAALAMGVATVAEQRREQNKPKDWRIPIVVGVLAGLTLGSALTGLTQTINNSTESSKAWLNECVERGGIKLEPNEICLKPGFEQIQIPKSQ